MCKTIARTELFCVNSWYSVGFHTFKFGGLGNGFHTFEFGGLGKNMRPAVAAIAWQCHGHLTAVADWQAAASNAQHAL